MKNLFRKYTVSIFDFPLFVIAFVFCLPTGIGQVDSYDNYEWRIKQAYLFDTYIPAQPQEAFSELQALTPASTLDRFAGYPEDSIRGRLQLTLGKWIGKNWQLSEGSRLSHYFIQRGLSHPDDMGEFLIIGFHRHLNNEEIKSKELIDRLVDRRKSNFFKSREKVKKELISIDTIKGEAPE